MKKIYSVDIIEKIIKINPQIKKLHLGAYKYVPRALDEKGRLKIYPIKCDGIGDIRKKILSIKLEDGWDLALLSKVILKDGARRHIPQIDFECPVSNINVNKIKIKLSEILKITPGYIINSGVSYHFIGTKLFNETEWRHFMGLCLLLADHFKKPIVDVRWCGHQLMSKWSDLRILANRSKPEPKVVTFLNRSTTK